jgi:Zn-finger nucleic acid-binding protein
MDCPHCHKGLEEKAVQNVPLGICRECGGLWLDSQKLKALTKYDLRSGRVLNCFRCNRPMKTTYVSGVEIDICPECKSMWLDTGELKAITGLDFGAGRVLSCPGCKTQLQTRMVDGVEVDVCPSCTGIFLDRGELERITAQHKSGSESEEVKDFFSDVSDVRVVLALSLYKSGKHGKEKAAQIAGMTPKEFDEFVKKNT